MDIGRNGFIMTVITFHVFLKRSWKTNFDHLIPLKCRRQTSRDRGASCFRLSIESNRIARVETNIDEIYLLHGRWICSKD
jgi:hypothetical protein